MEPVRKTIILPSNLVKQIEQFAHDNYINNFTAAVIELVRRGLRAKGG